MAVQTKMRELKRLMSIARPALPTKFQIPCPPHPTLAFESRELSPNNFKFPLLSGSSDSTRFNLNLERKIKGRLSGEKQSLSDVSKTKVVTVYEHSLHLSFRQDTSGVEWRRKQRFSV